MSDHKSCQHHISSTDLFCRRCGQRLGVRCICGACCVEGDRFCWQCGQALTTNRVEPAPPDIPPAVPQRAAPDPQHLPDDLVAEAEQDDQHYQLGHSMLHQDDIDSLFEGAEEP